MTRKIVCDWWLCGKDITNIVYYKVALTIKRQQDGQLVGEPKHIKWDACFKCLCEILVSIPNGAIDPDDATDVDSVKWHPKARIYKTGLEVKRVSNGEQQKSIFDQTYESAWTLSSDGFCNLMDSLSIDRPDPEEEEKYWSGSEVPV